MRSRHERQLLAGVSVWLSALAFGIFASGAGKWNALVLAASFGAYYVMAGLRGLRSVGAFPVLSASQNLIRSGKLGEAEALLATLEPPAQRADRARSPGRELRFDPAGLTPLAAIHMGVQRAQIAMRRGDPRAARDVLDGVIARAGGVKDPSHATIVTEARGLRAWARAASEDAGASEDIEAVRGAPSPTTAALSHASLAEAFLAQRRGDRSTLTNILRRDRRLLMYGLDIRERALVRAVQRLLATPATSVYRTAASVEKAASGEEHEPPIAEWIGRIAPELRPFAPRPPPVVPGATADEQAPSAAMVARVRALSVTPIDDASGLALWAGFTLAFLIVYKLPAFALPLDPLLALASLLLPLGAFAASAVVASHRRRVTARLVSLSARVACGEDVDAELDAFAEAEQGTGTVAAQIELLRAAIADRRGLLGRAIDHANAARAKLSSSASQASAASFIAPSVTASRAYSLAALRRADEAMAELSQLPADYVHLDSTRFVVRLVSLVALGEIDAAGRLADATAPELSIGPRDELLRDLVRAATSPGGAGVAEIARLREELRDDDEHRVWIERVAPALLARFERAAAEEVPRERAQGDAEDSTDAELEAFAEEEARLEDRARRGRK